MAPESCPTPAAPPRSPAWRLAATCLLVALAACGGGGGGSSEDPQGNDGGNGSGGGTAALPTVSIGQVSSNTLTQPGTVPAGGLTDDSTPQLSGSLSAALATGQKLRVYDGDVVLAPEATVSGLGWTLTPASALAAGEHRFSAEVIGADGKPGTRSAVFAITMAPAVWLAIEPGQAVRATPTTLRLTGSGWPITGWTVEPLDDSRASCEPPSHVGENTLDVSCSFFEMGERKLALKLNGQTVAQPSLTVNSNVSGVSWSSPSTGGFGTAAVRAGETVQFKLTGTQLLSDSELVFTVEGCQGVLFQLAGSTDNELFFSCPLLASLPAGQKAGMLRAGAEGPVLAAWQLPVQAPAVVAPALKLPHSGVTASQCYDIGGGTALVACASPGATALNGQQDGHRTGSKAMSFSRVASFSLEDCVLDKVTGLVWEGKTRSGMRSGATLVNHIGLDRPDLGVYSTRYYVAQVNAMGLCGYSDWRLPSLQEMQTIVDYSLASPGPVLPAAWFPNTGASTGVHWTATAESSGVYDWVLDVRDGSSFFVLRQSADGSGYLELVRLVRGAP